MNHARSRRAWSLACLPFFLVAGCQAALNDQRTVNVASGEIKSVLYEVQKKAKTVRVDVRSSGVKLDAYLVLEKDRGALLQQLEKGATTTPAAATAAQVEETTLEKEIPAGSAFNLVLANKGGKDAQVSVKVTEKR
jgi:hypothetical protein